MSISPSSISIRVPVWLLLCASLVSPVLVQAAATDPCAKEIDCTLPDITVGKTKIQEADLLDPNSTVSVEVSIQAPSVKSPTSDWKLQTTSAAKVWDVASAAPKPAPGVKSDTYFKGIIACYLTWTPVPHHTYYAPSTTPAGAGVPPITDITCDTKGG